MSAVAGGEVPGLPTDPEAAAHLARRCLVAHLRHVGPADAVVGALDHPDPDDLFCADALDHLLRALSRFAAFADLVWDTGPMRTRFSVLVGVLAGGPEPRRGGWEPLRQGAAWEADPGRVRAVTGFVSWDTLSPAPLGTPLDRAAAESACAAVGRAVAGHRAWLADQEDQAGQIVQIEED